MKYQLSYQPSAIEGHSEAVSSTASESMALARVGGELANWEN